MPQQPFGGQFGNMYGGMGGGMMQQPQPQRPMGGYGGYGGQFGGYGNQFGGMGGYGGQFGGMGGRFGGMGNQFGGMMRPQPQPMYGMGGRGGFGNFFGGQMGQFGGMNQRFGGMMGNPMMQARQDMLRQQQLGQQLRPEVLGRLRGEIAGGQEIGTLGGSGSGEFPLGTAGPRSDPNELYASQLRPGRDEMSGYPMMGRPMDRLTGRPMDRPMDRLARLNPDIIRTRGPESLMRGRPMPMLRTQGPESLRRLRSTQMGLGSMQSPMNFAQAAPQQPMPQQLMPIRFGF
jgi:hypothetical protein